MIRRITFMVLVGLLAVALMAPTASAGRVDFRAPLSHAQEVGVVNAPGAHGLALFWVDGSTLHYQVSVKHLTGPATQAHIHAPAERGADAGVSIWLCGNLPATPAGVPACSSTVNGTLVSGSVVVTMQQLAWMETGQAYVNVHTALHPPGEVRGQILDVGGRR
jgi:hypothetical protein